MSGTGAVPGARASRLSYIDWMRGLAVVIMIMAHSLDSWTLPADKTSHTYWYTIVIAGMGAPLFLFLAGVSIPLATASRMRRGATPERAAASVRRRGWEIFGLAFLFRLQSWLLSPGASLAGILKVDILNVMGPAIAGAATLWDVGRTARGRCVALAVAACAFSLVTPAVRASETLAMLPDPLEWYLRPAPNRATFTFFPWAGFVFAGAALGIAISSARDPRAERQLVAGLSAAGTAIALASFAASYLPSPLGQTSFWTTSLSYYFLRIGLMTAGLSACWLWERRPWTHRWSPLLQFGRTSLFVYWIHVEMAYGVFSRPLHRSLPFAWSVAAFVVFTLFLLLLSVLKDRLVDAWRERKARRPTVRRTGSGGSSGPGAAGSAADRPAPVSGGAAGLS